MIPFCLSSIVPASRAYPRRKSGAPLLFAPNRSNPPSPTTLACFQRERSRCRAPLARDRACSDFRTTSRSCADAAHASSQGNSTEIGPADHLANQSHRCVRSATARRYPRRLPSFSTVIAVSDGSTLHRAGGRYTQYADAFAARRSRDNVEQFALRRMAPKARPWVHRGRCSLHLARAQRFRDFNDLALMLQKARLPTSARRIDVEAEARRSVREAFFRKLSAPNVDEQPATRQETRILSDRQIFAQAPVS